MTSREPIVAEAVAPDGPGLAHILDLRQTGPLEFTASPTDTTPVRMFGGRVAGQAVVAAGRTVARDRGLHSLHAHFLQAGDSGRPVDYRVDAVRDGSSFSVRRVVATQQGEDLCALTASFHVTEDGWQHQVPRSRGRAPETLAPGADVMASAGRDNLAWFTALTGRLPIDIRFDGDLPRVAALRGVPSEPRQRFWVRSRDPLPDDPLIHVGAVTFASDALLLSTALAPHATTVGDPALAYASLDHTVWFHRPFRADDWFHYDQQSTWAGHGRALCRGLLFDREGGLVASVVQEALIRRLDRSRR